MKERGNLEARLREFQAAGEKGGKQPSKSIPIKEREKEEKGRRSALTPDVDAAIKKAQTKNNEPDAKQIRIRLTGDQLKVLDLIAVYYFGVGSNKRSKAVSFLISKFTDSDEMKKIMDDLLE